MKDIFETNEEAMVERIRELKKLVNNPQEDEEILDLESRLAELRNRDSN